jgi:polysaccharide export outer membrane protein
MNHSLGKNLFYLISIGIVCLTTSCVSRKRLYYFNDQVPGVQILNDFKTHNAQLVKPNNRLIIIVTSPDLSLVSYLNPQVNLGNNNAGNGSKGYLVNLDGMIDFPMLGKVRVEGLTTEEVAALLKEKLSLYYKELFITVSFNGEINYLTGKGGGSVMLENQRLTIFEVISKMPNLDPYDYKNDVWIIREDSGKRYFAKVNLNSKKIFESEYYYLKSNDFLYIKPSRYSANLFNTSSPIRGFITILGSLLALFLTLKNVKL